MCSTFLTRHAENFNPRPPRGGRPEHISQVQPSDTISIHALREEGDQNEARKGVFAIYFNPRPPRGGRLLKRRERRAELIISIHALREEGDEIQNEKE